MLIRELKFIIFEYIFEKETLNFLISNGYEFNKRNLHYYTIKAFQQDKLKIACDLVSKDNFDLDFSWEVTYPTKLKSTKEKFNKKLNVLSYLIYRKCKEDLMIKDKINDKKKLLVYLIYKTIKLAHPFIPHITSEMAEIIEQTIANIPNIKI